MKFSIIKKFMLFSFAIIFFVINAMEQEDCIAKFLQVHIEQAIHELPAKSGEGVSLIKDFLKEIQQKLASSSIFDVLEKLQNIRDFALTSEYQKEKFRSITYQTEISLTKFVQLFIDPIINGACPAVAKKGASPKKEVKSKSGNKSTRPVGLVNFDSKIAINNRCFINAAIQCLYSLKDLNKILINNKKLKKYLPNSIAQNYVDLILKMQGTHPRESKSKINALNFSLQIWNMMQIDPSSPADSAELIEFLLNHLLVEDVRDFKENKQVKNNIGFELVSLRLIEKIPDIQLEQLAQNQIIFKYLVDNHPEIRKITLPQFIERQTNYEEMLKKYPELFYILEQSSIARSFFSKLLSKDQQKNSITKKTQMILTLPLQPNQKNIVQCLDQFFDAQEKSHNDNLLNQLNQYVYRLNKIGKNFIISLNRNSYNSKKKGRAPQSPIRIETAISFNLNLDLSKYSEKANPDKYSLIACLMHSRGSSGKDGHYTAYTKHGDKWYFCNDTEIKTISLQEMQDIAKRGYGTDKHHIPTMFFYQKN